MTDVIECQVFRLVDLLASSIVILLLSHNGWVLKEFVPSLIMALPYNLAMILVEVYSAALQIQIKESRIC